MPTCLSDYCGSLVYTNNCLDFEYEQNPGSARLSLLFLLPALHAKNAITKNPSGTNCFPLHFFVERCEFSIDSATAHKQSEHKMPLSG